MKAKDLFKKVRDYNSLIPFVHSGNRHIAVYVEIDDLGLVNVITENHKFYTFKEFTLTLKNEYTDEFVNAVLSSDLEEIVNLYTGISDFRINAHGLIVSFEIWNA